MPDFGIIEYEREKAVAYAHRWAYGRNPDFYDFSNIGGDCTNFASQCIFAGSGVMNFTPTYGWYYINVNDRAPAWTGVEYLYNFLTTNKGAGPFAIETDIQQIEPGDVVQLKMDKNVFQHTPVVVEVGSPATLDNVLVAAHSNDSDCRPLSTYPIEEIRYLHIEGVRFQAQP